MAEAVMKKLLLENNICDVNVFSRGLSVFENSPASLNSIEAVKKYDIDLSKHRARLLLPEEVESSDLLLTMSEEHKASIISLFPKMKNKIFTLYEFAFGESKNISDPFGGDIQIYERCLNEIYNCVEKIVNKNK